MCMYCHDDYMHPLPQSLEEPPPDSFDSLAPTVACPPGGVWGKWAGPQEGEGVELAQLRQFTFSSDLQRMSVLVRVYMYSTDQMQRLVNPVPFRVNAFVSFYKL